MCTIQVNHKIGVFYLSCISELPFQIQNGRLPNWFLVIHEQESNNDLQACELGFVS